MSDADQLAAIGQKLTAALTSAYTSSDPNAALVFVPGGVPVPDDLVESGIVNPTRMQTFLETYFNSPFVISPSECAVHGKDDSHGSSSEIYVIAATSAQPLGSPTDGSWKRVAAEIAMAQRILDTTGMEGGFFCEPDDWVLPSNTSYWSTFDSSQTQPAPAPSPSAPAAPPLKPILNPHLWMIHTLPVASTVMHAAPAIAAKPPVANLQAAQIHTVMPMKFNPAAKGVHPVFHPTPTPTKPTPPPPPPSSTITVQLQHQCVTLAYMSGGVTWWDGAFLADTGWFIPGMTRGALLPIPQATALNPDLAYGIPVALIVVQGLKVSGNWTGETAASLGAVGPFSLQGAIATAGNDSTVTFSRPGMQVIALLCSRLPILPPVDAPAPTVSTPPATTASAATPTTPAATPPADATPPATPGAAPPSAAAPTASTPPATTAPAATPATPAATPPTDTTSSATSGTTTPSAATPTDGTPTAPAPAATPSTPTNASPPASTPKTTT